MAWLADFAGKAENFLNKLDKNTADALQSIETHTGKSRSRSSSLQPENRVKSNNNVNNEEMNNSYLNSWNNVEYVDSSSTYNNTNFTRENEFNNNNNFIRENQHHKKSNSYSSSNSNNDHFKINDSSFNSNNNSKSVSSSPKISKSSTKIPSSASISNSNNNNGDSVVNGNKKTDDELLEFLNTPTQRDIDETSLLKNELVNQTREMGLLLKNHKQVQQENENLKKALEESNIKNVPLENESKSEFNQMKFLEDSKMKDQEISELREKLSKALEKLGNSENIQELKNNFEKIELENKQLMEKSQKLEIRVNELGAQIESSERQSVSIRDNLSSVENEYVSYKEKAKGILKSKDDLIASLKNQGQMSDSFQESPLEKAENQFLSEIEFLKNERELFNAEIAQNRALCESLREDRDSKEAEIQKLRITNGDLQQTLCTERDHYHSTEEENLTLSQQLSRLQFDLEREKMEKKKIEEKYEKFKTENETKSASACNMMSMSMSKSSSFSDFSGDNQQQRNYQNVSPTPNNSHDYFPDENENLRTRISALSQTLLERQSLVNNLSSDKQLLQIKIERLQNQVDELTKSSEHLNNGGLTHTVISSQPLYPLYCESPWDSRLASKVKRVASRVDSFCCQLGLQLRHRPNLRLGFSAYILMLHMWVFFILFSWSHNSTNE